MGSGGFWYSVIQWGKVCFGMGYCNYTIGLIRYDSGSVRYDKVSSGTGQVDVRSGPLRWGVVQ